MLKQKQKNTNKALNNFYISSATKKKTENEHTGN